MGILIDYGGVIESGFEKVFFMFVLEIDYIGIYWFENLMFDFKVFEIIVGDYYFWVVVVLIGFGDVRYKCLLSKLVCRSGCRV